jgi:hypothetical protein
MKLLLLTTFIIFCTTVVAQSYRNFQSKVLAQKIPFENDNLNPIKNLNGDSLLKQMKKTSSINRKQSRIIYLQTDNMPCVVPSTPALGLIPNAWKQSDAFQIGLIPNGGAPKIFSIDLFKKD